MKLLAYRLKAGDPLKEKIEEIVASQNLNSATFISAVGSLSKVVVRMAGASPAAQDIRTYEGSYEVVSLIGNLGQGRTHLHVAFSDSEGNVVGGHLKEGTIVHTTAELVIAADNSLLFSEEVDDRTGFGELRIDKNGN